MSTYVKSINNYFHEGYYQWLKTVQKGRKTAQKGLKTVQKSLKTVTKRSEDSTKRSEDSTKRSRENHNRLRTASVKALMDITSFSGPASNPFSVRARNIGFPCFQMQVMYGLVFSVWMILHKTKLETAPFTSVNIV